MYYSVSGIKGVTQGIQQYILLTIYVLCLTQYNVLVNKAVVSIVFVFVCCFSVVFYIVVHF